MSRRWLNSLDVEYDPIKGAILTDQASPSTLVGGTRTANPGTPQKLVATATPCRFVWIGARVDDYGNPLNYYPVFIGDSAGQNLPVMPSNYEGLILRIDDASKLYVRTVNSGEGVAYRIFA
jgi:hypothetical protein